MKQKGAKLSELAQETWLNKIANQSNVISCIVREQASPSDSRIVRS